MRYDLVGRNGRLFLPETLAALAGRREVDRLNVCDPQDEQRHGYAFRSRAGHLRLYGAARMAEYDLAPERLPVIDGGRAILGWERFRIRAEPGRDLTIVLRTAPDVAANVMRATGSGVFPVGLSEAGLALQVDGQDAGRFSFRPRAEWDEQRFVVPGALLRRRAAGADGERALRLVPLLVLPVTRPDPNRDEVRRFYEENHEGIERARRARRYFYGYLTRVLRARIPPGQRVLDMGCGSGHLLAALEPSQGVGIDLSGAARWRGARELYGPAPALRRGRRRGPGGAAPGGRPLRRGPHGQRGHPPHRRPAHPGGAAGRLCHPRTRLFIYSYSRLWQPLLRLAELLRLKHRPPPEAWLPPGGGPQPCSRLADYEVVRQDCQIVFPAHVPLLADLLNRYAGPPARPGVAVPDVRDHRAAGAAPLPARRASPSTSVVIPCRNEAGHIRELVARLPDLGPGSEFLFVEGNSHRRHGAAPSATGGRREPAAALRLLKQTGRGKGDAVRLGFAHARGRGPADPGLRHGRGARGHAEVRGRAGPRQGRDGQRLAHGLPHGGPRHALPEPAGQQGVRLVCSPGCSGSRCGTRSAAPRPSTGRTTSGSPPTARSSATSTPSATSTCCFGRGPPQPARSSTWPCATTSGEYGQTNISRFRHGWLLLRMSLFAARKLKFV